jgi:hypothetical protein
MTLERPQAPTSVAEDLRQLPAYVDTITEETEAGDPSAAATAVDSVAHLATEYPLAVSEWTQELVEAFVASVEAAEQTPTVTLILESVRRVAEAAPDAVAESVDTLVGALPAASRRQQTTVLSVIAPLADAEMTAFSADTARAVFDVITEHGGTTDSTVLDLVGTLVSVDDAPTAAVAEPLIASLSAADDALPEVLDAIHELAVVDAESLSDHIPAVARATSAWDTRAVRLALLALTELAGVAPEAVVDSVDGELADHHSEQVRGLLAAVFVRVSEQCPELIESERETLATLLSDESPRVVGVAASAALLTTVEDPQLVGDHRTTARALCAAVDTLTGTDEEGRALETLFRVSTTTGLDPDPLVVACTASDPERRLAAATVLERLHEDNPESVVTAVRDAASQTGIGDEFQSKPPAVDGKPVAERRSAVAEWLTQIKTDAREAGATGVDPEPDWFAIADASVWLYFRGRGAELFEGSEVPSTPEVLSQLDVLVGLIETGGIAARVGLRVFGTLAEQRPARVAPYADEVLTGLDTSDESLRRLAAEAASDISSYSPRSVAGHVETLVDLVESGTPPTQFYAVSALLRLARVNATAVVEYTGPLVRQFDPTSYSGVVVERLVSVLALEAPDRIGRHVGTLLSTLESPLREEETVGISSAIDEELGEVTIGDGIDSAAGRHYSSIVTLKRVVRGSPERVVRGNSERIDRSRDEFVDTLHDFFVDWLSPTASTAQQAFAADVTTSLASTDPEEAVPLVPALVTLAEEPTAAVEPRRDAARSLFSVGRRIPERLVTELDTLCGAVRQLVEQEETPDSIVVDRLLEAVADAGAVARSDVDDGPEAVGIDTTVELEPVTVFAAGRAAEDDTAALRLLSTQLSPERSLLAEHRDYIKSAFVAGGEDRSHAAALLARLGSTAQPPDVPLDTDEADWGVTST